MHHGVPARDDESTVIPLRGRSLPEIAVPAVDLDDLNSPHTLAVLSIPPGSSVLDVGCGPGVVARALAARGCKVWGLEIDPWRAASARNSCIEVLEADVETVTLSAAFDGMAFDAVLFLDVLEHLRDPQAVLANAAAVLAPAGSVLLSIPNVTHGALRLEILSGRFRYRASGLLDRGHLRFFDADGVDELIRQAGFRAETRLRVTRRLDQTEFDIDLARVPTALRSSLESDVDALTYQFFVIARPARGLQSAHEGLTLLERQKARIDELAAALEKGSAYANHLQEELAAKDARLREIEGGIASAERARFEELALALEKGSAYARHLQEELTARDARLRELEAGANAERARSEELAATVEKGGAYAAHLQQELADATARLRQAEGACVIVERELEAKTARLAEVQRAFGDIQGELYLRVLQQFPALSHDEEVAEYRRHGLGLSRRSGQMLREALAALRSQRRHVNGDPTLASAYRTGIRFWKTVTADLIARQIRCDWQDGRHAHALRGLLEIRRCGWASLAQLARRGQGTRA